MAAPPYTERVQVNPLLSKNALTFCTFLHINEFTFDIVATEVLLRRAKKVKFQLNL